MEMKAGRELDALVAEKVMGMTVDVQDGEPTAMFRPGYSYRLGPVVGYSTDIAAAWEVVQKLDVPFELHSDDEHTLWHARFDLDRGDWCDATTAPHAICLAALKAVGL